DVYKRQALSIMLRDFQSVIGVKHFIFEVTDLAPLIAAIICIVIFKYKKVQLAGLKFSISLKVIERILLALILPLIILIIGMYSLSLIHICSCRRMLRFR
ncbi:hypothetical protein QMN62_27275, partial [Escherichia coli]|nr:hypothetical protein [Escherichia coli]